MPAYTLDKELDNLGAERIKLHFPWLKTIRFGYMFRPEATVSNGKTTAGMCIKVDDRNRTIHEHDFIIEMAKDVWDEATPDFKTALMDHELSHAGIRMEEDGEIQMDEKTGRPKTYIKPHDIEEFEDILERHGDWHKGLRDFLNAFARSKKGSKASKSEENMTS